MKSADRRQRRSARPPVSRYEPALRSGAGERDRSKSPGASRLSAHRGVFVGVCGPNSKPGPNIGFLRMIGADAVGMSTVPEVIVAVPRGLARAGLVGDYQLGFEQHADRDRRTSRGRRSPRGRTEDAQDRVGHSGRHGPLDRSEQNPGHAGGHKAGQHPADHGMESEPGQIATSFGGHAADAPELNADGAKIGKPAQGVGEDHLRAGTELDFGSSGSAIRPCIRRRPFRW